MKHLLLTTIAAVMLVGCATTQQSAPPAEAKPVVEAAKPEPPTVKAPDISIQEAAKEGNVKAIKQHIAAGTDVNAKGDAESTPLHWAANGGHKEIAELFIANGADVNAKSKNGITPLHMTVVYGHKEVAELLIAKGADVNAKIEGGNAKWETPLDLAEEVDEDDSPEDKAVKKETADLLRKHGGKTGEELRAEGK